MILARNISNMMWKQKSIFTFVKSFCELKRLALDDEECDTITGVENIQTFFSEF